MNSKREQLFAVSLLMLVVSIASIAIIRPVMNLYGGLYFAVMFVLLVVSASVVAGLVDSYKN